MTTNEYVASLPMILDQVEVCSVQRISPSYVRVELAGACLAELGVTGSYYDQRFKMIFPNAAGTLPSFAEMDDSWWTTWLQIPEAERGSMRTYTIRDVLGEGADTRLVVDIVVHEDGEHTGPGNDWALRVERGERVLVLAPRRGMDFGGIEWHPGTASRLLIVGDETAVPAVHGILRDLPADATGAVFLEVPYDADVLEDVVGPPAVEVHWLPRNGCARGVDLHAAVIEHLVGERLPAAPVLTDDEIDPALWETPVHSSSGDDVLDDTHVPEEGAPYAGLYAWIAGESKLVTGLRRHLVNELGVERGQVAFMGYWREGVAMRS